MPLSSVTAATIATWEAETGPSPIHGLGLELETGGTIERHRHSRGQIMTAPSGVAVVKVGGRSFVAAGRKGAWVPEGTAHEVVASSEVQMRNLQISRTLAPDLPKCPCAIRISPLFGELLHSAVEGKQWFASGSREAKVLDLLVLEFRVGDNAEFFVPQPQDARLRKICATLLKDPSDSKSLNQWAYTAGGCTRTLERLFKKETGLTFAQWRRQVRIQDAIIRLHRGQSVTSVAYDAGYENISSFIEMFRRVTGRTPGQFLDA